MLFLWAAWRPPLLEGADRKRDVPDLLTACRRAWSARRGWISLQTTNRLLAYFEVAEEQMNTKC